MNPDTEKKTKKETHFRAENESELWSWEAYRARARGRCCTYLLAYILHSIGSAAEGEAEAGPSQTAG